MSPTFLSRIALFSLLLLAAGSLLANCAKKQKREKAVIAVAANFADTARELAELYRRNSGHEMEFSVGATGKLHTQIVNGAPFAAFFSADQHRPKLLEESRHAIAGSRFTYAEGRLVLLVNGDSAAVENAVCLREEAIQRIAIGKPGIVPYGDAAQQTLEHLGLWEELQPRLVFGESITNALQMVESGAANAGFVALSQVIQRPETGSQRWLVPTDMHKPLRMDAVLLKDSAAARGFLEFVRSPEARVVLEQHGYTVPQSIAAP